MGGFWLETRLERQQRMRDGAGLGLMVSDMIYSFGTCEIDVGRRELRKSGAAVHVEPQVFDLLCYLVQHPGRMLSKDELVQAVADAHDSTSDGQRPYASSRS